MLRPLVDIFLALNLGVEFKGRKAGSGLYRL